MDADTTWIRDAACRAARMARRRGIDPDDLYQEGLIAFWDCSRRHQPGRSSLRTFAAPRVRGAMLDYMRSRACGFGRGYLRDQARGLPVPTVGQLNPHRPEAVAGEPAGADRGGWCDPAGREPEPGADRPGDLVLAVFRRYRVGLTAPQAGAVAMRFGEDCTLVEIGRRLGITPFWASRLITDAVRRLRGAMTA